MMVLFFAEKQKCGTIFMRIESQALFVNIFIKKCERDRSLFSSLSCNSSFPSFLLGAQ